MGMPQPREFAENEVQAGQVPRFAAALPEPPVPAGPTNLPPALSSFVGREAQIGEVAALLAHTRLLTLTGPGGTGKTRLSLQVAATLRGAFADGVFLVSLAPIRDPLLVVPTIALALGVQEAAGQPLAETLIASLRERRMLLLLDNFEQVLAAAAVVVELLTSCLALTILATSRAALHVYGEHEYAVPPLALPDLQQLPPTGAEQVVAVGQYEAVRLFVDRARAVKHDFALTEANAAVLAEICIRLDGLPLAVELAAARSKVLSPQALLARLNNRLQLLTGGAHGLPTRQQTLRSTISWSYELLAPEEQALFRRLAVFVAGRTLEAVEAVADGWAPEMDVLDGLTSLVDKSLLQQHEGPAGEARFWMLETIHEFAWERLIESWEAAEAQRRHAAFFLALAERVSPLLRGPQRQSWLEQLEAEHDNLRAALRWSLDLGERGYGLQLGGALYRFWTLRGYLSEGRRWLEAVLAGTSEQTVARATALHGAGAIASLQGDTVRARALLDEALAIRRALDDRAGVASTCNELGSLLMHQGDHAGARGWYEQSLAGWQALGDQRAVAVARNNLGVIAETVGDYATAQAVHEANLALFRELGDQRTTAVTLINLGIAVSRQGQAAAGRAFLEEALALARRLSDKYICAEALQNLGRLARDQGDPAEARALFTESLALLRDVGNRRVAADVVVGLAGTVAAGQAAGAAWIARLFAAVESVLAADRSALEPIGQHEYEQVAATARATLGESAWAGAWAAGRALAWEDALAYALTADVPLLDPAAPSPPPPPAPPATPHPAGYPEGLSEREVEVLRLVATGLTNAQVAERLIVSLPTVNAHLRSIYSKLGVNTRSAATRFAIEHGLA